MLQYSAYQSSVMPATQLIPPTRYDIKMNGMADCENPAILCIDSRDRNHDLYVQPSNYIVKLDPVYKEVTSIELLSADIPNSGYIVDTSHNLLHFRDTNGLVLLDTWLTVELPVGNRHIDNICTCIADGMTALSSTHGGGAIYTCAVNIYTSKVTITQSNAGSATLFELQFAGITEKVDPPSYKKAGVYIGRYRTLYKERSVGALIGFDRKHYTGELQYTGVYTFDLRPYRYIALFVNQKSATTALTRVDAPNSRIKDAFCIIPLEDDAANFQYAKNYSSCDNEKYIKRFSVPVPEINELEIKFVDADGNLFNFNGHNHTLIFEIRSNTRTNMFKE